MTSITIVTACFNNEKTIADTLKSVRAQTFVGIEHVIVNARGASGGYNSRPTVLLDSPGHGACVVCTLSVSVGQVLNIFVGQKGGDGTTAAGGAGGFNGGAAGGHGAS